MDTQEFKSSFERAMAEKNFVGAYLMLRESPIEKALRYEYTGRIAATLVDELSRTRRDDRERIFYLRSILAWIFRDVPGLAALYREQVGVTRARGDLLGGFARGFANVSDVATGRKRMEDGFQDAAEDVRRSAERAADSFASSDAGGQVNEFLTAAERGIREGLGQLGNFFRAMNEPERFSPDPSARSDEEDDEDATARAVHSSRGEDVEDVEFEQSADEESAGETKEPE